MVFTPDDPDVYTLSSSAWLILHLCDGRQETEITRAFHAAIEPMLSPEEARQAVRAGLEGLLEKKIVEVVVGGRNKRKPAGGKYRHEQKASTR
jgi:hypothetical protein